MSHINFQGFSKRLVSCRLTSGLQLSKVYRVSFLWLMNEIPPMTCKHFLKDAQKGYSLQTIKQVTIWHTGQQSFC